MSKIGIFVDIQNIYYTCRSSYQKQFDYRCFWKKLSAEGDIVIANAYTTDKGDDGQRKFQDALRHIGFNVKLKPYIQRADGSAKGDWDVGITIDIIEAAPELDKVVLLSGDGDFDRLLIHIQDKYKVDTHVYGVPNLTALTLKEAANEYHSIGISLLK